jgi:hypothetical protein
MGVLVSIAGITLLWVLLGVPGAGWMYADMQGKYGDLDWRQDLGIAVLLSILLGPGFSLMAFCVSGFAENGWRLRFGKLTVEYAHGFRLINHR